MDVSKDGRYLVATNRQGRIFVWANWTASDPVSQMMPAVRQSVETLAFAPDNITFATGNNEHTIRIWQIRANGEQVSEIRTLSSHQGAVKALTYSPNGSMLGSVSDDQTIQIRHLNTSEGYDKKPNILEDHLGTVWDLDFSPNNRRFATGSDDETVRIWISDPQELVDGICERLPGKQLSNEEWDTFIGDDFEIGPFQKPCP